MSDYTKVVLWGVVVLVTIYAFGFLATGGDLAIYSFWAPKQANVERKVFENTQSYVQGKVSYLSQLRLDYEQATEQTQKNALRRIILTESAQIDSKHLPVDLNLFIEQLGRTQ